MEVKGGGGEIILGVQSGIHDFDFCCCVYWLLGYGGRGKIWREKERYGRKRKDMAGRATSTPLFSEEKSGKNGGKSL